MRGKTAGRRPKVSHSSFIFVINIYWCQPGFNTASWSIPYKLISGSRCPLNDTSFPLLNMFPRRKPRHTERVAGADHPSDAGIDRGGWLPLQETSGQVQVKLFPTSLFKYPRCLHLCALSDPERCENHWN